MGVKIWDKVDLRRHCSMQAEYAWGMYAWNTMVIIDYSWETDKDVDLISETKM